ncbi:Tetratricopeptide repeat-containing protein [Tenacibaculum sp. 190524A02b]|uniref:Tetratricopeptide repeat-containing protein n=1 Tax=Tenacibaculum vairaonense TaxID=3137860 RepID=A0ABM9PGY9_9FLAO
MKYNLTIIFALFFVFVKGQNQESILKELQNKVTTANKPKNKIEALLNLAEYQYDRNFSASDQLVEEALKLIATKKDSITLKQLAKAYVIKGVINRRKAEYPKAIDYYLKAKKIYQDFNDIERISDVLHNMGMVYRHRDNHTKAIKLYKQSIKIKKVIKDIHGMAAGYNMMGVSYRQSKNIDSAIVCYKKARELFTSIQSFDDVQRVNNNMVAVNLEQKKYNKALELALNNVKYAKKHQKKYSLCVAYRNLSNIYKKTKDFSKSLIYIDSSLQVASQEKFREYIAKAYLRKSFLNAKLGNYKDAYQDYRVFNRHSDSIFNIENIKKIQELELNYQFKQEKREVELLAKEEVFKKRMYLVLLIISLLSALGISYLLYRNYKNKARGLHEKLEKERLQKELLNQKIKTNEEETKKIIADNTMRLEFKHELLNRLKKEVVPNVSEDIKQKLMEITSGIQVQIKTEGKLSEVQNKITEVNKGFDTKLRELFPSLTKTEREICALLRLNLSIKEIMTVRNASLDAIKSARYRIRKKMKLETKQELEQFIQNLD